MKLNELKPQEGSVKNRIRIGRGIGSGKGKTSGKGHKGQKARSGVAIKGFEGGQMPLYRRLPKFGFSNASFALKFSEVTLSKLQAAVEAGKLDPKKPADEEALVKAGLVRRKKDGIKLLGTGALKTKLDLTITKATKSAQEAVEKAGGSISFIEKIVAPVKKRAK
ncbi:MAG: 50S ribosomal protein L15 [Alphaproteobacteria bacterium]|nr:50S ribosomal protein L15 [Alphaproteobacteria bacterium]